MPNQPLVVQTNKGIYCPEGDFYIDPVVPVQHALITHAHADHAIPGSSRYLCGERSRLLLKHRLGHNSQIDALKSGKSLSHNGVKISFFPAGHILGSCQIRLEFRGEVWVITGDFKRQQDSTCLPFEPVRCHTLIMESTFGLSQYEWAPTEIISTQLQYLIEQLRDENKTVIILAYALGKAQRVLSMIGGRYPDIYVDEKIYSINRFYRKYRMLPHVGKRWSKNSEFYRGSLILTTPFNSRLKKIKDHSQFAFIKLSGWESSEDNIHQIPLSDHADYPTLINTVKEVNPERVLVMHGQVEAFSQTLQDIGFDAKVF